MYLVCPPRVGVDGRLLREQFREAGVAALVLVREPTTQDKRWPVVAVGPVTVRAKAPPPKGVAVEAPAEPGGLTGWETPPASWMDTAVEHLGDEAVQTADTCAHAEGRLDYLVSAALAVPESSTLLDALEEAIEAVRAMPEGSSRRSRRAPTRPADDENDASEGGADGED